MSSSFSLSSCSPSFLDALRKIVQINNIKIIQKSSLTYTRLIGEGGQAKVYKGSYNSMDVAIKIFLRFDEVSLLHECVILSNSTHKSIPRLFGIVADGKVFSFVTEFISGITLDSRKVVESSVREKIWVAKKTAEVVRYLGRNGIIHRDIKPSNLLLSFPPSNSSLSNSSNSSNALNSSPSSPSLFLLDFGISRISLGKETLALARGTLGWVAPEGMEGVEVSEEEEKIVRISPKSDVYSLGVLFSFLFSCGELPWGGGLSAREIQKKIRNKEKFPVPKCLKGKLRALIESMTEADVEKRISAEKVVEELNQFKEEEIESLVKWK